MKGESDSNIAMWQHPPPPNFDLLASIESLIFIYLDGYMF